MKHLFIRLLKKIFQYSKLITAGRCFLHAKALGDMDKSIKNKKHETATDIAKTEEIKEIINNYMSMAKR